MSCRSTAAASLYVVAGDTIERHAIDAAALGFKHAATARLAGGTPEENARMTEAVLRGEPGIRRDVVLLNAGAALARRRASSDRWRRGSSRRR